MPLLTSEQYELPTTPREERWRRATTRTRVSVEKEPGARIRRPEQRMPAPPYGAPPTPVRDIRFYRGFAGYTQAGPQADLYPWLPSEANLTNTERYLLERGMPWLAQPRRFMGREFTWASQLETFNASPVGRALQVFDVGAEFVERVAGTAVQMGQEPIADWNDLSAVWRASTLYYDAAALTAISHNNSVSILYEARRRLRDGEDIDTVRADVYARLGTYAIRSQLSDAAFHIVVDPINILAPMLKPVQRIQNMATAARTGIRVTDEAIAGMAQNVSRLEGVAETLGQEARRLGKLTEVAGEAEAALAHIRPIERATAELVSAQMALAEAQGRALKPVERLAVWLTGGMPATPEDAARWASKGKIGLIQTARGVAQGDFAGVGRFGWLPWNWFRQTPESMAFEITRNLETTVQEILRAEPDINKVFALVRGAEGAMVSPQLQHLLLTPAGRANLLWLRRAASSVQDLERFMVASADDVTDIGGLARLSGMSTDDFMAALFRGEADPTWQRISAALAGPVAPELEGAKVVYAARVAEGSLTAESLRGFAKTFEGLPYSPQTLRLHFIGRVADTTAAVAAETLGVSARGFWRRATDSLKAVETLVYLRANPGYFVRNFVNNEFTMLARGTWGRFWTADQVASVWGRMGIEHPRLFSGFGAGQMEGTRVAETAAESLRSVFARAEDVVGTTARGGSTWAERAVGRVRRILPRDMGTFAADVERWASSRAMTHGLVDSMGYYLREGRAIQNLDRFMPGLTERMGGQNARALYGVLQDAWTSDEVWARVGGDLAVSKGAWLDDAAGRLGVSRDALNRVIGQEAVDELYASLEPLLAARAEPADISNVFKVQLQRQQRHIDDMVAAQSNMERAMAQMPIDGPGAYVRELQMMAEHEFDMMEAHLAVLDDSVPRIRDIGDTRMRHAAWRSLKNQQDAGWRRFGTLEQQRWQGVVDGAGANNLPVPDNLMSSVNRRLGIMEDFHSTKNRLLDEFFDTDWAKAGGDTARDARWRQIGAQMDELYDDALGVQHETSEAISAAVSAWLPQELRPIFDANQASIRNLRRDYGLSMLDAYRRGRTMPDRARYFAEEVPAMRTAWNTRIYHEHKRGFAALSGEPLAQESMAQEVVELQRMRFANLVEEMEGRMQALGAPVEGAVPTEGVEFVGLSERVAAAQEGRAARLAAGYGPDPSEAYRAIAYDETGRALLQEYAARYGVSDDQIARDLVDGVMPMVAEYAPGARAAEPYYIMDARALHLDPEPRGQNMNALWQRDGSRYWGELELSAQDAARRPPIQFGDMPADVQRDVRAYLTAHEGRLGEARMASMRMAEIKRDASLLNYSRRTEFDTFTGSIFPFAYWTTHSMWNWMLYSVDHPAMLSTYLKLQRMFATAVQRPGFPQRLSGYGFPFNLPGMPEWMGPVYIDPLRLALPFNTWQRAGEEIGYDLGNQDSRTMRVLDTMMEGGEISKEDYDLAVQNRTGNYWEAAQQQAANGQDNWIDAFSMITSPHAPLMWLYNASRGRPFQEGPFMPITRGVRSLTRLFGFEPAGVNIEAPIRKALGLPEFDQWEDYRIERQLANMAAEGLPVETLEEAMATRSGPVYEEAQSRAGLQYAVGGAFGFFGIPVQGFPPGEEKQRLQWEELSDLYAEKDRLTEAGDITQDIDQRIRQFYDEHPAMSVRSMINDPPERRMQQFLTDQIWDRYNALPTLNRNEAVDQLGPLFEDAFLNRETRSPESIPVSVLQGWAMLLDPEKPYQFTGSDYMPAALDLAPREIAYRVQGFYQARDRFFRWPEVRETQNQYFMLDEGGARKAFRAEHPELVQYWGWRRDWIMRNPDVIPYLVDNPEDYTYPSGTALEQALAGQPSFKPEEWAAILGQPMMRLVEDYTGGDELPAAARRRLEELADQMGITVEDLISRIGAR